MSERVESCAVAVEVSMTVAREMWRRANAWDLERGGRFDARGGVVQVWSHSFAADREASELVGAIWVYWHTPTEDRATVYRLEWFPDEGGSEAEVRRALAVLSGGAVS